MTFTVKVQIDDRSAEFIDSTKKNLSSAATGAMSDVADKAKRAGRANIASNGFSSKWQNALRSVVYPKGKSSLSPSAIIFHKIPYAGVFENQTTITAKTAKYLWIPMPGISGSGRSKKISPKEWVASKSNLQFVQANGKAYLVVKDSGRHNTSGLKSGTPVFYGVTSVSLKKKFNILGAVQSAANSISAYFDGRLKKETE